MRKTLEEWLNWQETLHSSEIDLGLNRIRQVAKTLNLLKPDLPIITVAGTNGKGSSIAILEAILVAQGYKVGSYTSPHLLRYNERIKLNAQEASNDQIINAFKQIDKARGNTSLSYFEFGTLAAVLIFSQQDLDIAILEVGLGGRLDAANLWDASLAIITSIAIDHESWLGNDRETIAIEKSGIMRAGKPVICGDPKPPKSIELKAKKIGANLFQLNNDFSFQKEKETWQWEDKTTQYTLPFPLLSGDFQLNNAATVIAGLQSIKSLIPVSYDAIKLGLTKASIAGRLQVIHTAPNWLLDVAHNPHSATELAKFLKEKTTTGKTYAIFSMLKDKDIKTVISIMDPYIDAWHLVALKGSRGIPLPELKQIITQQKVKGEVIFHDNFAETINVLKKQTNLKDKVVAFGSFLVVSEVMEEWKSQS